jgi:hypothetical protein
MHSIQRISTIGLILLAIGGGGPALAQTSYSQFPVQGLPALTIGGPAGVLAAGGGYNNYNQYPSGYGNGYGGYYNTQRQMYGLGDSYNTGEIANPALTNQNPTNPYTPPSIQPPGPDPAAQKILDRLNAKTDSTEHSSVSASQNSSANQIGMILRGHGVALGSNEVAVDNKTIFLTDVKTPIAGTECLTPQKTNWPCGDEAKMYLQSLLDQGQVVCVTLSADAQPSAICHIGNDNLATGMNQWPDLSGFKHLNESTPQD